MVNLFLYGTLRHPELLEMVAGRSIAALAPEPARLQGFRAVWAAGHDFPLIVEAPGAVAEGLLLRAVAAEVLERLNYYELSFGYDLRAVTVAAGSQAEAAQVYFPQPGLWQPGEAFSLAHWAEAHWPLTRHSAAELMGYFGHLEATDLAWRWRMVRTRAAATERAGREHVPSTLRSPTGREAVEVLDEVVSHAGFFLTKTLHLRHPRFDGSLSEALWREVFVAGDAATVLPYDPHRDRVLLVEQFRLGPFARGDRRPWQLEPIAGRIDGGESAEASCRREAEEEAGLRLTGLEKIASYYASPGYSSEVLHSFVGLAELPDGAAGVGGAADEHEDIRSHVVAFDDAMRLIETGEAGNGPLILSLLWLARERGRLRAEAGVSPA